MEDRKIALAGRLKLCRESRTHSPALRLVILFGEGLTIFNRNSVTNNQDVGRVRPFESQSILRRAARQQASHSARAIMMPQLHAMRDEHGEIRIRVQLILSS